MLKKSTCEFYEYFQIHMCFLFMKFICKFSLLNHSKFWRNLNFVTKNGIIYLGSFINLFKNLGGCSGPPKFKKIILEDKKMKKIFIAGILIIILAAVLYVAYDTGFSKGLSKGKSAGIEYQQARERDNYLEEGQYNEIRSAMKEEIVTRESEDYLVLDKYRVFSQKPVCLRLEDYLNDPSVLTVSKLRRFESSRLEEFQEISTDEQWQEMITTFGYSEEDALVIKFIPRLVELNNAEKAGFTSLPLTWLPDFDISKIDLDRLQYKMEILAWKYGYTTRKGTESDGPYFTEDGKRFNYELAYLFYTNS